MLPPVLVDVGDTSEMWQPTIDTAPHSDSALYDLLLTMDQGATIDELSIATGQGRDSLHRQLSHLVEAEKVVKERRSVAGRGGRAPIAYYAVQR
jgi:predicted transcriptional regulator